MNKISWFSVNEKTPIEGIDVLVNTRGLGPPNDKHYKVQRMYFNAGSDKPDWPDGWRKGDMFEVLHWAYITAP
jgi:hypothetical protein